MTIYRGCEEIQLTDAELRLAYNKQQHKYDTEDVIGELESCCDGSGSRREQLAQKILDYPEWVSQIAETKRDNMERCGMPGEEATENAVNAALKEAEDGE